MVQNQAAREAHVAAARRRLSEITRELKIQLPVYLMVTKCDLVAGFTEYFDDLAQEGRAQVWGVTFPYEQTLTGDPAKTFPAEARSLVTRLNERVFTRLEEERDVRRRVKVFAFPQQMAVLSDPLAEFVGEVCAATRFDQQVLLRGVYFTSGTQEGTPIDRLLGALGRRFAVAPDAVAPPPGRGKAYFIERLLKDVLLAESGIAGVNRRLEMQKAAAQLGAYAAMVLAAVLALIVLSVSYSRNRTYVDEVAADVTRLREAPPVTQTASLEMALPRLDAVRAVADSGTRFRDDTPYAMRWGLFQGSSLGNAAHDAYLRELDAVLLPRVAARFKERLVEYAPEPEKLYEYLKAYLMLGQPEHLDETHLAFIGDLEWERAYANDPDTRASLSKHFRSLLEGHDSLRPVMLDDALVAQARSTIRQASVPSLMYGQVRLGYSSDTGRGLRLDVAAGVGSEQVLRRKSGVALSVPVPSLYTKRVFEEVANATSADLVRQFASDHWVWGEGVMAAPQAVTLKQDMLAVYEKDYIAAWDKILNDIDVVPFSGPARTSDTLARLAGSSSPLRGLLKAIDEQTFIVKPADAGQQTSVGGRLSDLFQKGKKAVGLTNIPPGSAITEHFDPIHRLVAGEAGTAPIDRVIRQIGEIQQKLGGVGRQVGLDAPSPVLQADVARLARALEQDATTLPPAPAAVVAHIARGARDVIVHTASGELETRYQQEVARPCMDAIEGRYPFNPGSPVDIPLVDFGRVFGYNGVFDTFFKSTLQPYVDTSRSPWTWRPDASGAMPGRPAMLRQFQDAERIRDTFFRPGAQMPELRFTVTPADLDAGAARFVLEIDGQSFDYRHGPERNWPASWPGPNPGVAAATFEERAGGRPNLVFQGPWAWFRLINAGQVQRETDVRHLVSFAGGGHQASVHVEAASLRNPWVSRDWQQFRCGL